MNEKWEKARREIVAAELKYLKKRRTEREPVFRDKLDQAIPAGVKEKLENAFAKGFDLVFQKGNAVIEKTYSKEERAMAHRISVLDAGKDPAGALKKLDRNASAAGTHNLILSGVEGIGLGIPGIGIPDIPLFIGMLLKSVYEIAMAYGFPYEGERERIFILRVIRAALCRGERLREENRLVGEMIVGRKEQGVTLADETRKTADALSERLLYLKFVQGLPIVGVVGGAADIAVMKEVTTYASLIYKKRYLRKMWEEEGKNHET